MIVLRRPPSKECRQIWGPCLGGMAPRFSRALATLGNFFDSSCSQGDVYLPGTYLYYTFYVITTFLRCLLYDLAGRKRCLAGIPDQCHLTLHFIQGKELVRRRHNIIICYVYLAFFFVLGILYISLRHSLPRLLHVTINLSLP